MDLRDALEQISHIREQVARSEVFRGYRSATVAFSGLLAIAASVGQSLWLARPDEQLGAYLALWIGVAMISFVAAALEIVSRARASRGLLVRSMSRLAAEQFAPCLGAGVILTAAVATTAPEAGWILPGAWSLLFGLGVFASYRLLPRSTFWVGAYYLLAGGLCLWLGQGAAALSPWLMAGAFGGGQLMAAGILFWTLERRGASLSEREGE
jgi:hypothetical protein